MKHTLALPVAFLLGCGSTEPGIDLATAPVAGVYSLVSQLPIGGSVFIPDTDPWVSYTSDVYTLSESGQWSEGYDGNLRRGATSTPISGTRQGTFTRSGRLLSLKTASGATYFSANFTGSGFSYTGTYHVLTYSRPATAAGFAP